MTLHTKHLSDIDPISIMLEAHRHYQTFLTGMEFAYTAHTFMRTHRFIPPHDQEDIDILRELFEEHLLEARRFTGSYMEWLQSRNDRSAILALAKHIPWDVYVATTLASVQRIFMKLRDAISMDIIKPLEAIHDLNREQLINLHSKLRSMSTAIKLECKTCKQNLDLARWQEGIPAEFTHELSFAFHDLANWSGCISSDLHVL